MGVTTTTLTAAVAVGDTSIKISSASPATGSQGFAVGSYVQLGEEFCVITKEYVSGTTIPVVRGQYGTFPIAHPSGSNVSAGSGSDFSQPNATVDTAYPLAGKRRKKIEYSAAGALTLPIAGEDIIAILNGTNALAMTLAVPTKDNDGAIMYIIGNGKAAHTVTTAGGLGAGSTGYTIGTYDTNAQCSMVVMAMNGVWVPIPSPMSGTLTGIDVAIS